MLRLLPVVLVFAVVARADNADELKAKASLALAKAKREREAVKGHASLSCHTDMTVATREATEAGRPLVVWVGVKCSDHPSLRKALDNASHVHVAEWNGSREKKIVFQGTDGLEYFVRPEKVKTDTAGKIRAKWELPYVAPIRFDVRIAEELSYRPVYSTTSSPGFAGEVCTSSG